VDPEQIYTEVLQEEQQKGSAAPVAEGRAKAARQRAVEGSPHPKEPKWWPGSQPHFEGGGEAAPAAEEAPAEEPVEEAAPAPEPEEAPAAAVAAANEPETTEAPRDVATAPAETSTPAPAPTSAPVEAPAAAAATEAPAAARPAGVTHGTPTGNRLRPEDGVSTEAQFEGQRAMYDRRKLIDELVGSGVPAVSASSAGSTSGSPMLALAYILIPILAVWFLIAQNNESAAEAPPPTETVAEEGGGGEGLAVSAAGVSFDTDALTVPAGEAATIEFANEDSLEHNIAFYKTPEDGASKSDPLWTGDIVAPGSSTTYETTPIEKKGEYYFQFDVHPNMSGALTVE
jgi:plastocyanin